MRRVMLLALLALGLPTASLATAPGTLGLLGTGLIGLAEFARRGLKLGR